MIGAGGFLKIPRPQSYFLFPLHKFRENNNDNVQGIGMQEYERYVLEQYNIDVSSTRKIRGAVLCDTDQGPLLLRETATAPGRISALYRLYDHLWQQGYHNIDQIILNKEGECLTVLEDGSKYLLKRWFQGRECDIRKPAELLEAAGNLAKLHILLQEGESEGITTAEPLDREYERHDRELKKVRRFVRNLTPKGEFEVAFLKCFDQMYQWTEAAGSLLSNSSYRNFFEESIEKASIVHGEYNYHNILMIKDSYGKTTVATVNFEKYKLNIQTEDLYYFLRKVMEKQGWKERLGDGMLNAYSAIRPLDERAVEYLKIRLAYPEKFWKIANSYYHSNKAWISAKSIEKLNTAIAQTKEKERFLNHIFSFHL